MTRLLRLCAGKNSTVKITVHRGVEIIEYPVPRKFVQCVSTKNILDWMSILTDAQVSKFRGVDIINIPEDHLDGLAAFLWLGRRIAMGVYKRKFSEKLLREFFYHEVGHAIDGKSERKADKRAEELEAAYLRKSRKKHG